MGIVCSELGRVRHKWLTLGIQLGIPRHVLEHFKRDDDPLSAAVDYWLRGNVTEVPITWDFLVEALKSVDEKGCADTISKKYCTPQDNRVENGLLISHETLSYLSLMGWG